jgi:hypothetical protein
MQEIKGRVEADKSFLMTLVPKKGPHLNFILPLSHLGIEDNQGMTTIIFDRDFTQLAPKFEETEGPYRVVADITDDPTPAHGGSVVSLGYPLIRVDSDKKSLGLDLLGFTPLTFRGKSEHVKVMFNRCQRDSLIKMPEEPVEVGDFDLSNIKATRQYHLVSPGFCLPLYRISALFGEKKSYTAVERQDMTSFHALWEVVYQKKHKTKQAAERNHIKIINKWRNKWPTLFLQ